MIAYKSVIAIMLASCAALPVLGVQQSSADAQRAVEWNFEVFLGDSKVGYHNYRLEQDEGRQKLVSEANFRVKLLFITLYKYQHENAESWQGECLQRIESRTIANGEEFSVFGSQGPEAFEVQATGIRNEVPGCVKTFAYWNRDFLKASALLNPQTGEILPVTVEPMATEPFTVRGQEIEARRYRLRAKGVHLDLWYSKDDAWLGLQSTTKNGHIIRYELI
jgi:hypothetical protein